MPHAHANIPKAVVRNANPGSKDKVAKPGPRAETPLPNNRAHHMISMKGDFPRSIARED
jgi:hypothetical protein